MKIKQLENGTIIIGSCDDSWNIHCKPDGPWILYEWPSMSDDERFIGRYLSLHEALAEAAKLS